MAGQANLALIEPVGFSKALHPRVLGRKRGFARIAQRGTVRRIRLRLGLIVERRAGCAQIAADSGHDACRRKTCRSELRDSGD